MSDSVYDDLRAPVVTGFNRPSVLESSEYDFGSFAAVVATLVVVDALLALFQSRGIRAYHFVFLRSS